VNGRPIRGLLAGLSLGIGVALLLIVFAVIALGTLTPYIIVIVGVIVGLLLGMFADQMPWRGGTRTRSSGVASGAGPAPGSGAPPA
jgi:hypothetical protein